MARDPADRQIGRSANLYREASLEDLEGMSSRERSRWANAVTAALVAGREADVNQDALSHYRNLHGDSLVNKYKEKTGQDQKTTIEVGVTKDAKEVLGKGIVAAQNLATGLGKQLVASANIGHPPTVGSKSVESAFPGAAHQENLGGAASTSKLSGKTPVKHSVTGLPEGVSYRGGIVMPYSTAHGDMLHRSSIAVSNAKQMAMDEYYRGRRQNAIPMGITDLAPIQASIERDYRRRQGSITAQNIVDSSSRRSRTVFLNQQIPYQHSPSMRSNPVYNRVFSNISGILAQQSRIITPNSGIPGTIVPPSTIYGDRSGNISLASGTHKREVTGPVVFRQRSGGSHITDAEWNVGPKINPRVNAPALNYTYGGSYQAGMGYSRAQNLGPGWMTQLTKGIQAGFIGAIKQLSNTAGTAGRAALSLSGLASAGVLSIGSRFGGVFSSSPGGGGHSTKPSGGSALRPPSGGIHESLGHFGTRLSRAATWAAYAPVFGAVGAVGGMAMGSTPAQQEEARATLALTGVNYTNEQARYAMHMGRVRAMGRPMSQPHEHIRAEYEIASMLRANPENMGGIRGAANFASKYQLFSQESFKAGTQNLARWMSLFKYNPRYSHLSDTDRLEEIGGVAALAIQESSAKGKDLAAELATSGPAMTRLGLSAGTIFGMGTKLRDIGLKDHAISTTFSKLHTALPTALAKFRFMAQYEKGRRDAGFKGKDTYFPEHVRSEFSESKSAKSTVNGLRGYQFVRQEVPKILQQFKQGTPEQQRAMIYELSNYVNHFGVRGKRAMQLAGMPEQALPVFSGIAMEGVIPDIEARANRLDAGGSRSSMDAAYREQYKPVSMAGESTSAWTAISTATASYMESIGGPEWLRKNITEPYNAQSVVTKQNEFIGKRDWGGLVGYHQETYNQQSHAPNLQKEIREQTLANLNAHGRVYTSDLHPQSSFGEVAKQLGAKPNPAFGQPGPSDAELLAEAKAKSNSSIKKFFKGLFSAPNAAGYEGGGDYTSGQWEQDKLRHRYNNIENFENMVSDFGSAMGLRAASLIRKVPGFGHLENFMLTSPLTSEETKKAWSTPENTPFIPMTSQEVMARDYAQTRMPRPAGMSNDEWEEYGDYYDISNRLRNITSGKGGVSPAGGQAGAPPPINVYVQVNVDGKNIPSTTKSNLGAGPAAAKGRNK